MQEQVETNVLSEQQIGELLKRMDTGTLATLNADGTPYVTPIHFIYFDNAIFLHGLTKGKKIDNIMRNPKVCFSVYEMEELVLDPQEDPCETNTKYESVIISGDAKIIDNMQERAKLLKKFVEKYTPNILDNEISENMIKETAVIRIDITQMSGKNNL